MEHQLTIYNTLDRKKELFIPLHAPHVGMYVCGPTVYGDAHLGHARPAITFDVLFRYLTHLGYKVRYVRNITDVGHLEHDADDGEDKIAKKARLEELEPMEVVQYFLNRYHKAMEALNVLSPSIEPHASGHIIEQIQLVQKILDAGYAYESEGSVYFDVAKYNKDYHYGKLSGRNLDDVLTVSSDAVNTLMSGSSICGLKPGDQLTLDQALYGLMLCSGNDAANVIAEYISGSTDKFAELMNKEAQALGATQSHFVNPHGLPDDNHYTTAYDLYLIFNAAIKDDRFVNYISTKKYTTSYTDASGAQVDQVWVNTNGYLKGTYDMPENVTVIGGKTGTTEAAGSCLVLYSESQDKKPYISIVLKGNSKKELYTLMTELLTNYSN